MSVINSQPLIGASGNQGAAYNIERSLRFRSSATAFLSRTNSSAPTSATTWTYSTWVKRGSLGGTRPILNAYSSTTATSVIDFSSDNIRVLNIDPTGTQAGIVTNAVFRDPSAWYHIVVSSTASSTPKLYVNGVEVTSFSSSSAVTASWYFGSNSVAQWIGREQFGAGNDYFDGFLAEAHYIDGQALTPSSFGETDTITGVWKPKKYTGTYGTNGFYLKFNDLTSTSTLGNDSSGNGNTWTVNNVSLTTGATYDSMTDVPTLTSATAANYAVGNPLNKQADISVTNGNLNAALSSGAGSIRKVTATIQLPSTGKYYWEVLNNGSVNNIFVGIQNDAASLTAINTSNLFYNENGEINNNGTNTTGYPTLSLNDLVGLAYDADANKLYFYKNNTLVNSGGTTPNFSGSYTPFFGLYSSGNSQAVNFGQRPFAYTPPSGFVALNTFNLPESTIVAGNKQMDATTYTGNGSTQTITNAGSFSPDLIWIKSRSNAYNNFLTDSVRGASKYLISNATDAEADAGSAGITAFNSNGFSMGSGTALNANAATYVGWQWRGSDSAAVTNTAGSITSTVSVNASAGFSVVTWTGTGSGAATVGHGLGVAPKFIITKPRGISADWICYNENLGNNAYLVLNSTAAQVTGATTVWGSTSPTSTVFSLGSGYNYNTTMVAYCWSEIAGFSKFGSYTGNGSTDGVFVYTGFRPKFILFKAASNVADWGIYDTSRSTFNTVNSQIDPNGSSAEYTAARETDILSNGFKVRNSNGGMNTNGNTYIYAAFAESPFKHALGR